MSKQVAIQGYEGSFHQLAARDFFGAAIKIIPCATFREVIEQAKKGQCDAAVMAIENSIAGSILPNYHLLQRSGLRVVGEVYLHIRQNLLTLPGVGLDDIREVHSHPMALLQCLEYLEQFPHWKLVETEDTALSARLLRDDDCRDRAAIAGTLAAELFDLQVLTPDIQTLHTNYTRFLILMRESAAETPEKANKASVNFHTDHSRGSLARVLSRIAEGGINLSKLQSFPIPGSDFRYSFHADMEFDDLSQFNQVLEAVQSLTESLRVYGIYKKGGFPISELNLKSASSKISLP